MTETVVRDRFATHVRKQQGREEQPELSDIHFVKDKNGLDDLAGTTAQAVPALLARYWAAAQRSDPKSGTA
jgi:hypothetical protein